MICRGIRECDDRTTEVIIQSKTFDWYNTAMSPADVFIGVKKWNHQCRQTLGMPKTWKDE